MEARDLWGEPGQNRAVERPEWPSQFPGTAKDSCRQQPSRLSSRSFSERWVGRHVCWFLLVFRVVLSSGMHTYVIYNGRRPDELFVNCLKVEVC